MGCVDTWAGVMEARRIRVCDTCGRRVETREYKTQSLKITRIRFIRRE